LLLHNTKGVEDCFFAYFVDIGGLEEYYGHFEYDAKKQNIKMMRKFSKLNQKPILFRK
jgi:hypothetical protein